MRPDHLTDTAFASLPLHPTLKEGLDALGFTHCTPIQAQTLPLALQGIDIAGQAQTGTGKSAAFLLATMDHLLRKPRHGEPGQPRSVMLAPTRELAIQIAKDAEGLGARTGLKIAVVYGGTGYESQRQAVAAGIDILIGTPGRLIDYFKQHVFNLKQVEVVVLDEADRMFDLGFIDDIRYLLRRMPPPATRRNYLFSATLSHRVLELAYEHMNNPRNIEVKPEQVTADKVRQSMAHVANDQKLPMLVGLLRHHAPVRTLIFVNTKRDCEHVETTLKANGFEAAVISGDVPQNKRERLLQEFKDGKLPVLIATDVAARGLHIPAVSHVINYDLPQDPEDYVHRIGRTARAGESGDAISLCCETYVYSLPDIERYIGKRLPLMDDADSFIATDFVRTARPHRHHHGGPHRHGGRPGGPRHGGGGRRPGGGGRRH
jgi:ATP-dependent RNA helicase RhlB